VRCGGDKGGGTNAAGSPKRLIVVEWSGDWEIGLWGLEGEGFSLGRSWCWRCWRKGKLGEAGGSRLMELLRQFER
jgi:hypothetical protein